MDILTLFFEIDEFCQVFEPLWRKRLLADGLQKRRRQRSLSLSEVMTILVLFHQSGYRNLKQFYLEFVCVHLVSEFPKLVSYNRFVEFERDALLPLAAYLETKRGVCTGISFVDSTKLAVCENLRTGAPSAVSGFCRTRQNECRLVLRLQTPHYRERARRVALVVHYARQCGRPPSSSRIGKKIMGQALRR